MIDAPAFREHINASPAISEALGHAHRIPVNIEPGHAQPLRPVTVQQRRRWWVAVVVAFGAGVVVGWYVRA